MDNIMGIIKLSCQLGRGGHVNHNPSLEKMLRVLLQWMVELSFQFLYKNPIAMEK
jgi:hypothetical protein